MTDSKSITNEGEANASKPNTILVSLVGKGSSDFIALADAQGIPYRRREQSVGTVVAGGELLDFDLGDLIALANLALNFLKHKSSRGITVTHEDKPPTAIKADMEPKVVAGFFRESRRVDAFDMKPKESDKPTAQ